MGTSASSGHPSVPGIKEVQDPWEVGSHADTSFTAAEFSSFFLCLASPSLSVPPSRCVMFSDDGFQVPRLASGALRKPGTYPGAPWGPREAQTSVISVQVGEGRAEVRELCHGEKEVEQCLDGSHAPWAAPVTYPLSVSTPPVPDPLPPTVLGPTSSPPPPPLQSPEG